MKNNLEQVKEVIVKVVPGIMELKFGCKIDNGSGFIETIVQDIQDGSYLMLDGDMQPYRYHGSIVKKHILGRDIELSDVMSALFKNYEQTHKIIAVLDSGQFIDVDAGRKENPIIDIDARWEYGKPLHLQSPETLEFLKSILV